MIRIASFLAFFFSLQVFILSANDVHIAGTVRDSRSKEALIGAQIFLSGSGIGTATDVLGHFELSVPAQSMLYVRFIGYQQLTVDVGSNDTVLALLLLPESVETEEVTVRATSLNENIYTAQSGTYYLSAKTIKQLPTFLGEADPIRALTVAPGVTQTEGSQGFSVRGAGRDQNLILLNGAPVYNPSHLLGLFSIFNADAIQEVTLMKSGIPAQYGGRLSSVMLVETGTGMPDSLSVKGSMGLLSSNLRIAMPVSTDRLWIALSGRRTYINMLTDPISKRFGKDDKHQTSTHYGFSDFDFNAEWRINKRNYADLSGYWGNDVFEFKNGHNSLRNNVEWGNRVLSLRWRFIPSSHFSWKNTVTYSAYQFRFGAEQQYYNLAISTDVETFGYTSAFYKSLGAEGVLRWGAQLQYHRMEPNDMQVHIQDELVQFPPSQHLYAVEPALFVNADVPISSEVLVSAGVRLESFTHLGPYNRVDELAPNDFDSTLFSANEPVITYYSIQPRLSARYLLNEFASLKASYNLMNQSIHLTSMSSSALPADIWFPSSIGVRPMIGHQLTCGYFQNLFGNRFSTSIELYGKIGEHVGEMGDDFYQIYNSARLEESALWGKSRAYGTEVSLKKESGALTGSVSFTVSRSEMKTAQVNNGDGYLSINDKPIDGTFFLNYMVNPKWAMSSYFVYSSGKVTTMPVQRYLIAGNLINYYTGRNEYRMPDYHRLDVSVTRTINHRSGNTSQLVLSVYNVYSRLNPYYIYFETSGDIEELQLQMQAKAVSFFPILPSIAWRFQF